MARSIDSATKVQVEEWVKWSLTLTHTPEQKDPFDPSDGGDNWNTKQTSTSVIFLAALAATEEPPDQPSDKDDPTAGDGDVVYHEDNGRAESKNPPHARPRTITIGKNDNRDILIPLLTEAACKVKYKKVENLNNLAKKINDKEKRRGIPSVSIEFDNLDDQLPSEKYSGDDLDRILQNRFLQKGNISDVAIPPQNVFHQPAGTDKVAYDCYCVILKRTSLGSHNLLKFGGGLNKYRYEVEYRINVR